MYVYLHVIDQLFSLQQRTDARLKVLLEVCAYMPIYFVQSMCTVCVRSSFQTIVFNRQLNCLVETGRQSWRLRVPEQSRSDSEFRSTFTLNAVLKVCFHESSVCFACESHACHKQIACFSHGKMWYTCTCIYIHVRTFHQTGSVPIYMYIHVRHQEAHQVVGSLCALHCRNTCDLYRHQKLLLYCVVSHHHPAPSLQTCGNPLCIPSTDSAVWLRTNLRSALLIRLYCRRSWCSRGPEGFGVFCMPLCSMQLMPYHVSFFLQLFDRMQEL